MTAHRGVTAAKLAATIVDIINEELAYEPERFNYVKTVAQLHREFDDELIDLATEILDVRFDLLDTEAEKVIAEADALIAKELELV